MKSLLWALLWAGSLAFFGYLLIAAIPLVAPKENFETVCAVVENGRYVAVAFFGFLGAIVGLFQHASTGADAKDVTSLPSQEPDPATGLVADYQQKLQQTLDMLVRV